jgi:invasion protein IalB
VAPLFAEAAPEKQAKKSETLAQEAVKASAPQSHNVALKPEPAQPAWVKVCGQDEANSKEVCFTTREFVIPENDQPIMAVAIYDVKGMPEKMVRFRLPLSLRLQPGIRVNMDNGTSIDGKYAVCFPNGCYVEMPVKEEFVTAIKNGKTLRLRAQNQIGEEVVFESPVDGFGKSYDGKAIDPKELAEQQKKLQEALIERSEAMRKKLEAQEKERAEKQAQAAAASVESTQK